MVKFKSTMFLIFGEALKFTINGPGHENSAFSIFLMNHGQTLKRIARHSAERYPFKKYLTCSYCPSNHFHCKPNFPSRSKGLLPLSRPHNLVTLYNNLAATAAPQLTHATPDTSDATSYIGFQYFSTTHRAGTSRRGFSPKPKRFHTAFISSQTQHLATQHLQIKLQL